MRFFSKFHESIKIFSENRKKSRRRIWNIVKIIMTLFDDINNNVIIRFAIPN